MGRRLVVSLQRAVVLGGLLAWLSCGLLLPSVVLGSSADPAPRPERRMILDEDFNWLTGRDADRLLDDVAAAGFNAVVPVVWHGRGVSWQSEMAPKEPLWEKRAGALSDPLQNLIERAHAKGIEVHPWFTVSLRQRDFLSNFYDAGTPPKAFNVHSREFREFIVVLMAEVVRKYPVDGINLDYIRASGVCTSTICINDYRDRLGADLLHDKENMWRSPEAGQRIARWLQAPIADIVEQVSKTVREIRPGILISVDSHPDARWVFLDGGDSITWANKGWVDLVLDMQYGSTLDVRSFERARSRMKNPEKLVIMPGNFERSDLSKNWVWPRNADLVAQLVQQARDLSVRSRTVALYEYRFLTKTQSERLRSGPFRDEGATRRLH